MGRHSQDLHNVLFRELVMAVVHDLKQRLLASCVPSFLTDGLWSYFYAITAHFGYWLRPKRARTEHWSPAGDLHHGQLVKRKTGRKLKYAIQRMAWGSRRALGDILEAQGFSIWTVGDILRTPLIPTAA